MNNTDQEVKLELEKFILKIAQPFAEVAKVVSVNEVGHTCILKSATDDSEFTAQLSAGEQEASILIIPKVGSVVFVRKAENGVYYITQYSETEKIILFGGELGGMIKINDLVNKLNKIEQNVNKIASALNTWIPVPSDGGLALKNSVTAQAITNLIPTQKQDLENPKITQ